MDSRVDEARHHHQAAIDDRKSAAEHLAQRDDLVRALHAEGNWSYAALAAALGCSREVVAKIVKPQARG